MSAATIIPDRGFIISEDKELGLREFSQSLDLLGLICDDGAGMADLEVRHLAPLFRTLGRAHEALCIDAGFIFLKKDGFTEKKPRQNQKA